MNQQALCSVQGRAAEPVLALSQQVQVRLVALQCLGASKHPTRPGDAFPSDYHPIEAWAVADFHMWLSVCVPPFPLYRMGVGTMRISVEGCGGELVLTWSATVSSESGGEIEIVLKLNL